MLSTGTLLALDILLMSGFLFFIKKRAEPSAKPAAPGKTLKGRADGLKDLASMNKSQAFTENLSHLDLKVSDLEHLEKSLLEREKKLDSLTKKVEERLKNIDLLYEEQLNNDIYSLALRMVRKGSSQEDITKKLGLLNGEAELIESIKNYRAS